MSAAGVAQQRPQDQAADETAGVMMAVASIIVSIIQVIAVGKIEIAATTSAAITIVVGVIPVVVATVVATVVTIVVAGRIATIAVTIVPTPAVPAIGARSLTDNQSRNNGNN